MNRKIILSIVVVLLIIVAGIAVVRFSTDEDTWICKDNQWIKHGNPESPMPQTGCGQEQNNDSEVEINFSKVGNITNFDTKTQMETQSWRFLYEEPGAPAISIMFVPVNGCKYYYLSGEIASCLDTAGNWYNGQRVKMDGQMTGDTLRIAKIWEQSSTQIANPASVYCEEHGGTLEIRDTAEGQVGWCIFPDGRQCEEWDFFRSQTCTSH